jgi:hypothetical protein
VRNAGNMRAVDEVFINAVVSFFFAITIADQFLF